MNKPEKNIPKGKYRDENGYRKVSYRRFKEGEDYDSSTGDDLFSIYQMEIDNAEREKRIGRPPRFETPEELWKEYINFLKVLRDEAANGNILYPGVENFASYIGIHRKQFNEWEINNYRGFAHTINKIKNSMASIKMQMGEKNKIPALVLAMDMNNNHGYTQRQEMVVSQNNPMGDVPTIEEVAQRFRELPDGEVLELPEKSVREVVEEAVESQGEF